MTTPTLPKAGAKPAAHPAPAPAPAPAGGTPAPTEPARPAPAAPAAGDPKPEAKPKPADKPAAPASKDEPKEPRLGDDVDDGAGDEPRLGDDVPDEVDGDEAGDKPATEDGEADGDEQAEIAYEFEAPEGQEPYSAPVIDAYKAVLQKHRVPAEAAREILDTMLPAVQADFDERTRAAVEAKTHEWREQLRERHGKQTSDVIRSANRALKAGASPELQTFLRDSALAVNPDFIDLLAYFGQRVGNDRSVTPTESRSRPELSAVDEAAAEYERNEKRG
jgi:hypothetical protein